MIKSLHTLYAIEFSMFIKNINIVMVFGHWMGYSENDYCISTIPAPTFLLTFSPTFFRNQTARQLKVILTSNNLLVWLVSLTLSWILILVFYLKMHMYNNQCLRMYNWDVMGGALEHTCMIPCLSVTFIQFPFRHITIIGQVTGLL